MPAALCPQLHGSSSNFCSVQFPSNHPLTGALFHLQRSIFLIFYLIKRSPPWSAYSIGSHFLMQLWPLTSLVSELCVFRTLLLSFTSALSNFALPSIVTYPAVFGLQLYSSDCVNHDRHSKDWCSTATQSELHSPYTSLMHPLIARGHLPAKA